MISVRLVKRGGLGVLLVAALASVTGVSTASAEELSPWWGVTTGARPTNLQSGVAKGEVEELNVSATGGEFALIETEKFNVRIFPWNASAEAVQEGLEEIYGSRKVEVRGGPGDEGGTKPYIVTFPGQQVEPLLANGAYPEFFPGGKALSGGNAEANVIESVKGTGPDGQIVATVENRGDADANGETAPFTVVDKLPPGLEAVQIEGVAIRLGARPAVPVSCSLKSLSCTFSGQLAPYEQAEVRIGVIVRQDAAGGEQNSASVSGGGAVGSRTASHSIEINGAAKFGIDDYQVIPENVDGLFDTQAGSHPFQVTSVVTINTQTPYKEGALPNSISGPPRDVALPKDIVGELPAGLVGNPTPFAQCTDAQFDTLVQEGSTTPVSECPAQSAIGVVTLSFTVRHIGFETVTEPVFNMVPNVGEPARFGFLAQGAIPVFLDASVRTGGDYGINISSSNITQISSLIDIKLTFWGVPGDPRHDGERGWECIEHFGTCPPSTSLTPPPFLMLPTSCAQPFETTVRSDSWGSSAQAPEPAEPVSYRLPEAMDGCDRLPFAPKITVSPDIPDGSSSTGLTVGVHVPQKASLDPKGLGESTLKDISVTLPEGVALNPSGADGLEACSEGQIGFTGVEAASGTDQFTPDLPSPFCPNGAKIGTAKIKTPLLANPLEGEVYLAAQDANPFGSLVAMYLVAEDPVSGTLVKLPGEVSLNQGTGQITATFKNSPELPFEDAELHFFGGERAPLATPAHCGTYTTDASFAPWSGSEAVASRSSFAITAGPNGGPCPGASLPFAPSLSAGTTNIQAGAFSPFTLTMSREDGQQNLKSIQLHMPPGLSGVLTGIPLCGEVQADAGTCSAASLLGETIVSVGLGGDPYSVKGGQVFLTGPYKGAPFGLSIVNPAVAGPFNLGKVIVRAKLEVDPHTAAVTVTSDDSGPYAIPPRIDGIPLQIKHVNVTITRPGFTFNPTNCTPSAVTGTLQSIEGASSSLSVPFQPTNCAILKFAPKFAVSTSGKTSKAQGASLNVKLIYPKAPFGTQANIARVKVDLPKQLPSRLTTLQKACTNAQFEANPAGCPAASIIGHAKAITPLIPVPLEGPAYFVSHGGEAFPSLIIVLQGYNVTLDLVGTTFISKAGITSSTFKTVPDAPVGSFELNLPEGKYSALAANGTLCKTKLAMPTEFLAQNGAKINQSTKISVTGCPKAHKVKKKHTKKAAAKRNGKR